ncbi:MAG: hypothetical protein R2844_06540 [Caldilineales bacterium]
MPRLTVWFIRSSLLYLAAGFTLGADAGQQRAASGAVHLRACCPRTSSCC